MKALWLLTAILAACAVARRVAELNPEQSVMCACVGLIAGAFVLLLTKPDNLKEVE